MIAGINDSNEIQPEEMRIKLVGAPPLDAETSIGIVFDDRKRLSIQLADYWRLDPRDNSLVIPAEAVGEMLSRLPDRPVQVMLGLAGLGGDFAYAVRFELRAPAQVKAGTPA